MERHGITRYPLCEILYKKDNSEGWYLGCMGGEEEECKKKCEKLKEENGWYDYKFFAKSWWAKKPDNAFQNYKPHAKIMHITTDLIYHENKYYFSRETIPYPKDIYQKESKFKITVKGEGEVDCLEMPEAEEDFEETDVLVYLGSVKADILTIAEYLLKEIPKFIDRLKKDSYSNLILEEYTQVTLLAWKREDKIKFILQDYTCSDMKTIFNKLISTDIFYTEFDKLSEKLKYYISRKAKTHEELNKQIDFLNSLKWVYNKERSLEPEEYSLFKWNTNSIEKLKNFADYIYKNADNKQINGVPFTCLRLGDYYYWIQDSNNCIYRTYYKDSKIKDILRFINSNKFKYIEGMSLNDIYEQLFAKGENEVLSTIFKDKRIIICRNGKVVSSELSSEEIKKLENVIIDIIKEKHTITARELGTILMTKKYVGSISYDPKDFTMILKNEVLLL